MEKAKKIRVAQLDDLPVILDIMNDAILNTTAIYDYHPRSLDFVHNWFDNKQKANIPVIVVEQNGTTAGFGSYAIFRPWEAYKFSAEHSVYVAKEFQGRGLGGYLLQALIDKAKQQGFHTLIAGIDADNKNSIAFHAKYGFAEVARFKEVGYKFNRWLDLVFMQLFLAHEPEEV